MNLLFLHGWGFDARMWGALRAALAPVPSAAADRGYFGHPAAPRPTAPFVAVGHSLGSLLLAAAPPPGCAGLIAINGFDRFTGEGRVPARMLERMRRRFADHPREVTDAFRARCGAGPAAGRLDAPRLAADLDALAMLDATRAPPPLLVLHGAADPLLEAPMRAAAFAGAPCRTLADGGHLLPLTHPEWCAAQIRAVLR